MRCVVFFNCILYGSSLLSVKMGVVTNDEMGEVCKHGTELGFGASVVTLNFVSVSLPGTICPRVLCLGLWASRRGACLLRMQEVAWARPLNLNLGMIARDTSKFYKYRHRHNIAWCGDVNNHFAGKARQECHLWSCTLNVQMKQASSSRLPSYAKELLFLPEFYSRINQTFLWCTCVA